MNLKVLKWRDWILPTLVVASLNCGVFQSMASCTPLPPGAISWWPAEGDASDLIGNNPGVLEGGATASNPGYVGNCFTFDGTNGFVAIPDSPSLDPTNLTIECWVKFDGLDSQGSGGSPAGEQYMVFKQNTRTNFFEGFFLGKVRIGGRDAIGFGVSSSTGQAPEVDSTITVTTNTWYYVAGVRGTNFIQLYINGVLNNQTNVSFPQNYGTNGLYLGSSGQPYWDHKLKGELDEVTLYGRPLGPDEIAAIYAAGHQGKCKTPTVVSIQLTPGMEQSPQVFPLLTIGGLPGQTYGIQTCTPLNTTNVWVGLTNLTLPGYSDIWLSPTPVLDTQRFYRAVPGVISIP